MEVDGAANLSSALVASFREYADDKNNDILVVTDQGNPYVRRTER